MDRHGDRRTRGRTDRQGQLEKFPPELKKSFEVYAYWSLKVFQITKIIFHG